MLKIHSIFKKSYSTPKTQSSEKNRFIKAKEEMHNHSNSYFYDIGQPVWTERSYEKFANEAYRKNVIAHRSIHMIAQAASSVPLKLFEAIGSEHHVVFDHPILRLLQNPNPLCSGKEFIESVYIYRLLNGNVYILGIGLEDTASHYLNNIAKIHENEGEIAECSQDDKLCEADQSLPEFSSPALYTLRPDRVQIIAGDKFTPLGYRYTMDCNHIDYLVDKVSKRSPILHIKNFNPLSDWYGLSSIEAAAYSIDQHNQASAWNQALLQNGARPSGAIIVKNADGKPTTLNDTERKTLRSSMDECFTGPQNAGKPLLLEGGLEWQGMSLSPKDMDHIESKNSSAREIALALGVPPQMLGIPGDNTYSNLVEARLAFWEQTVIPIIESTVNSINGWLALYFGPQFILTYDLNNVSALAERRDIIWHRAQNCDFMTINEKRHSVGLSPLEGKKYDSVTIQKGDFKQQPK